MGLELRQQLKLSQQLVMTPQLQQAIRLLQLSRMELVDVVQQELLENPLLDEKAVDEALEPREQVLPESSPEALAQENTLRGDEAVHADLAKNAEWDTYLGEFSSTSRHSSSASREVPEEGLAFDARLSSQHSLQGHLLWQLRLSHCTEKEKAIGEVLIDSLNSHGYLHSSVDEVAVLAGVSPAEVIPVLEKLQHFDPIGVAARDPQECLLIQLEAAGHDDPVLLSLVSEHLDDLEKRRYKALARKFNIALAELREYLDILQSLDPLPGASFGESVPHYISPDAFVYYYNDEFIVVLNEEGLPSLQLNSFYFDSLQYNKCPEKEYLQEKMRSAMWLMKSLYQRQRTLHKVVESIVRFQEEFFHDGVSKLKPLVLKDVADDIDMHESTISRITTSKYVATAHGVYELKFFFNSALELDDGTQVGSESVKSLIMTLIEKENPKKPLSDEKIAEQLKEALQVNIARRTVAKYRNALDIPSSSRRREIF